MDPSTLRVALVPCALAVSIGACRHAADPPAAEPIIIEGTPIEIVTAAPPCPSATESTEARAISTVEQGPPVEWKVQSDARDLPAPDAVIADGYGVVIGGDVAAARRAAIDDALAAAVEQVLGVSLESERAAENYTLLIHRIEASSDGFIRTYEILEESRQGDIVQVRLAAVVAEDRWQAERLDDLRVAIEAHSAGEPLSEAAARELRSLLQQQGFVVVTLRERHDLLVCAEVWPEIVNTFGGRNVAESEVTLTVRRAGDGAPFIERTFRLRGDRSNRPDVALRTAQTAALGVATEGLSEELASRRDRLATHRLLVCGVPSWRCRDALTRDLEGLAGIARATVEVGDCGTAVWDLELSPQALRDFPRNLERLDGVQLRVSDTGPRRTVARLQPAG